MKTEKVFLQKIALDPFHDDGEVTFAVFGDDDADGITAGFVEIDREVARPVVELAGRFMHTAAGFGGEVLG